MKNIFAFVIYLVCLIFLSCKNLSQTNNLDKSEIITKAYLLSDIPSFDVDTKQILHYPDSAIIFSYKDYVIYNSYKINRVYIGRELGDTTELEMVKETKCPYFYVYKKSYNIGYYFDSITAVPRNLRIDSFFRKNSPKVSLNDDFENYFDLVLTSHNKGQMQKIFSSKEINTGGSRDSLILSFAESGSNLNYSIAKSIDKKFGFNLVKLKMILNAFYDSSAKIEIPRLETFVELRNDEITEEETKSIFRLIESIKSLY